MATRSSALLGRLGGSRRAQPGSPAEQVSTSLFDAVAVLRVLLVVYVIVLNAVRFDDFARPGLAVIAVLVTVVWSGFTIWAYRAPGRRHLWLYLADLGVAVLLILSTPIIQSQSMLDRHAATMPSFWVATSVLAFSAGRHWIEAVIAALVVSLADIAVRETITGGVWGNIILLLLAAGVVGYAGAALREAAEVRAAAERAAAAYAERSRLARAVHDGVLQVLALVQRRGAEAGGDFADLGRLAGEQEVALRALMQSQARTPDGLGGAERGAADLVTSLEALASSSVTVSGPGRALLLGAEDVAEVLAVVRACLDNITRHVGDDSPAWVFVEDLGQAVMISVRDEGAGIPDGRLPEAEAEGRLGISGSIRGRMSDLGGTAVLHTGPHGTEWELTLPRAHSMPTRRRPG